MSTQGRLTEEEFTQLLQLRQSMDVPMIMGEYSPLLQELADIERPLLQSIMQECAFDPGEIIFHEGEPGEAMYVIRAGQVAVIKGSFETPTWLGYRGPGEIIGEMALLEHAPRSASVVALEPLRMLRIHHHDFQELIQDHPAIGQNIMEMLSTRLRTTDNALNSSAQTRRQLTQQVAQLYTEKGQLLELQRVRQETSDLIVHDLRNPLGVLYGILDVLKMTLPEEVLRANQELFVIAEAARDRMKRLIDSLLDVARMEEGSAALTLNPGNLTELLARTVEFAQVNAQRQGVTLRLELPSTLPPVLYNESKIERVLANLMDNAFKYTPKNGEICIAATAGATDVQVSVTDAGPGVPEAERQRIFERFTQVQGDTVARRRGFGLGLTFCKLAVEAHGGAIWVEPGPGGVGARFIFALPFAPPEIGLEAPPEEDVA